MWREAIIKYEKHIKSSTPSSWEDYYNSNAAYALNKENFDVALNYCDSSLMFNNNSINQGSVAILQSSIYLREKKYKQALERINFAEEVYVSTIKTDITLLDIRQIKAEILLTQMGEYEILTLFNQILDSKDSLSNQEFNFQLDELRTIHQVDILKSEKQNAQQKYILVLFISIFLFIIIGIYFFYSRRLTQKNKILAQQISELNTVEKEVKKVLINLAENKLSNEMQLFIKLNELIRKENLFADPNLNRKTLSELMNTNETYIADAVREGTGLNFSSYISDLRLSYSLELLIDGPLMTLDSIAIASGHGSYSPFFRAFSKKYGMTPSEYRKYSHSPKELTVEIN